MLSRGTHLKKRTHASIRAYERYGIRLTSYDIGSIIWQVTEGTAEKERKITQQISVYWVWVQGHRCRIVYNRYRKFVITFLPKDAENGLVEKSVTA